ncbi:MAG: hypothetical protein PHD82_04360 [Candidatus Riflebacteria bacterium]|nr:hypothetical protein [Candidatus Riflebacteria bacterium]
MKVNRLTLLVLFIALFTVSAAWCDVVADLMANNEKIDAALETRTGAEADVSLKLRESELFSALLSSHEDIQRFIETADASDPMILQRFFDRVRFEVAHEGRSDLNYLVDNWHGEPDSDPNSRSKKKVAFIYGSEVNLLDGEWREASDGRRFWVSNEYPDIVLSAAEYKKYAKTATVVED